jgi:uncharacterized protein (TIGR03067 family)
VTKYLLSLGTLLVLLAAGNVGRADDSKDIQGVWKVEKAVERGKEMPAEKREKIRLEFKDGKAIAREEGDKDHPADYTIDSAKSPKHITIKPTDKDAMEGIYKLEGDTLTICLARDGRPNKFEAGDKSMLLVLKRDKK